MKLTELFHLEHENKQEETEELMTPQDALLAVFGILTRQDATVSETLRECVEDTQRFCLDRQDMLERRGLRYSDETAPWLRVISAVEISMEKGYLVQLCPQCTANEFCKALKKLLSASKILFSVDKIRFDAQKNLVEWVRQFNEYAGQSGVTLEFVDLYSDVLVMGAAQIADYAEAAELAGFAGVRITSRPD